MRHGKTISNSALSRAVSAAAVVACAALFAGCAGPPADPAWVPPTWPAGDSIVTVLAGDETGSGSDPVPAADTAGLIEGRVRNDAVGLQARYVEMTGAPRFNRLVRGVLDGAIESEVARSGVAGFTPEVFDVRAGLSDRGCVPDVSERPAAELLADPAFGPATGEGTAVACELTLGFGPVLGVMFRTVTGSSAGVEADEFVLLLVNTETDETVEGKAMWTHEAAGQLWQHSVEEMRREAGALSTAPLAAPDDVQLELATKALNTVRFGAEGFEFTLPAGLSAAELVGLGVEATHAPLKVSVADLPDGWLTPQGQALFAQADTPFAGVPAWHGSHSVDCDFVACVAVTYDDGPSAFTAELLDILSAQESPATFFMMGTAVPGRADVVARAAAEGHELASHSMTHPDLTGLSPSAARREIVRAGKAISDITGQPVTMYRPPYGAVNDRVLKKIGLPAILWSIDTLDWEDPGEAELVKRAVDAATPGDIILFHDTHADTVNAADDVLAGLKERGFTPVTVTQLFGGSVPHGRVFAR